MAGPGVEDSNADISAYCIGKPRTLVSSHSGAITLAVSLQEPVIYLPSASPQGSSSYNEHDNNAVRLAANDPASTATPPVENNDNSTPQDLLSSSPSNNDKIPPSNGDATTSQVPPLSGGNTVTDSINGGQQSLDLPPSILRGSILLKLTKPTKLKSLSLSFSGKSKTAWSQSARQNLFDESLTSHPMAEIQDEVNINEHHWEFLPWESSTTCPEGRHNYNSTTTVRTNLFGADVAKFKNEPNRVFFKDEEKSETNHNGPFRTISHSASTVPLFTSIPPNQKRKQNHASSTHHKESAVFPAGEYVYNFILAIDPSVPETVNVTHGSVHYNLIPKLIRTGPFTLNISEQYEVEVVRSPPNLCDSISNNPIVISRSWDERLHYEILIPQKYIPLGSSIPIAIKLTPLEKIMVHRVRVHVIESVEYRYSTDTSIYFTDRSLKILLFEKKAQTERVVDDDNGANNNGNNSSSSGGGLHLPLKGHGKHHDNNNSNSNQKKKHREKLTGNLLHYLDPSDISNENSSRAIEDAAATTIDCTLPFLSEPTKWDDSSRANFFNNDASYSDKMFKQLHPDSQNCPYIKVRHRFTISFRISKQDPEDVKRRHFEVKIDTPVHFLSKFCSTENIELPQYNYEHLSGSVPLTQVNSNDSSSIYHQRPTSTTYALPHHNPFGEDPPLPSFDDALAQSVLMDSDVNNNFSNSSDAASLPPDYDSVVSETNSGNFQA